MQRQVSHEDSKPVYPDIEFAADMMHCVPQDSPNSYNAASFDSTPSVWLTREQKFPSLHYVKKKQLYANGIQ